MKKIILNIGFPTLNEYIDLERGNKFGAAALKKRKTGAVAYLASESKIKIEKRTDIIFTWFKPNERMDHDNICFAKKFVLDGLVLGGVLKNDSPKYVGNFQDIFIVDKTRDYVSCIVEFVE
jgi:hypothetical protein